MYALKPILVDQTINLPQCMYKLKSVNSDLIGNMQEESKNNSVSALCKYFVSKLIKCGFFVSV
jgi:hypothetical protein